MESRPVAEADRVRHPAGPLLIAVRAVGVAALAGMAVAILACVILLPAYAELDDAKYQRDCLAADIADAEKLVRTNERLIEELPNDPVLTFRVARSQFDLLPPNEVVVTDSDTPRPPAPLIDIPATPRPTPPQGTAYQAGKKLDSERLRRGLMLIAASAMLAAMFLFAPRGRERSKA